jgi:hypothetical protein
VRRLIAVGIAVVATLQACKDDEIGNTSGSGAASPTGGMYVPPECGDLGEQFTDATCRECAKQDCCEELAACDANADCTNLMECRGTCTDAGCVDQCEAMLSAGVADLGALDTCLAGPCKSACPMSSGICDTSLSLGTPECDACVGSSCCAELNDCLDEADCNDCMTSAAGVDCETNALFVAAADCFSTSCGDVCQE